MYLPYLSLNSLDKFWDNSGPLVISPLLYRSNIYPTTLGVILFKFIDVSVKVADVFNLSLMNYLFLTFSAAII